ncbi:YIP1 family protein [Pontivivens ytuae]|uniref:YIP1 family protein n=1 Tax=Pontivivens ytuae TaxID=2789856 RepID=A0A7S9LRN2_9RHOB|nr:YIP1 family protein [Pontivivens ytuae]QPH53725.1 YIP1 family protein [Pontivivens ytuae]
MAETAPTSVAGEIPRAWGNPRAAMRRQMSIGDWEGRALTYLLIGAVLWSLANLPVANARGGLSDDAAGNSLGVLIAARVFQIAIGVLMTTLVLLLVAAFTRLVARLFGGQGSWSSARLALGWSFLACAPLALLAAVVTAAALGIGTPFLTEAAGLATLMAQLVLLYVWSASLAEAEGFTRTWPVVLTFALLVGGAWIGFGLLLAQG